MTRVKDSTYYEYVKDNGLFIRLYDIPGDIMLVSTWRQPGWRTERLNMEAKDEWFKSLDQAGWTEVEERTVPFDSDLIILLTHAEAVTR